MVFFNDWTGVLMVRATPPELNFAQKAIETLNLAPPQLTVEAKYMELSTESAGKLGLELPPPVGSTNIWMRILNAGQMRAVLRAAMEHSGTDILSAPRVTTLSGRQTQIQAGEVRSIVTGIDPQALTPPGVRATKGVKAQPFQVSPLHCGPVLEVLPEVAGDGYTIQLNASTTVTEFLGYNTTLDRGREFRVWVDNKQQNVTMPLSRYRIRQMQAAANIYDGQTLVLANPMVTMISTQPNGQSLTNSVSEDPEKRLVVFITPTIIDPAGNPIRTPGGQPWADKSPPQPKRESN